MNSTASLSASVLLSAGPMIEQLVSESGSGLAPPRRVALVHDWLTTYVGGERVLEQMIALHPHADVFTSIDVLPAHERAFLQGKQPITSFAQSWPFMRKHYRHFLPLLMLAIEQLDVSDAELVLSSSASIGKGVLTGPDQLHIAYVHSPMRYAWDLQHQYLRDAGLTRGMKALLARWLLHKARLWDMRTANGVDHFIANSEFIARRIFKVYRREATVIYPPVDVQSFPLCDRKEEFYLTAQRLVPYKKVPAIVEAFRSLRDRKLVVVGDGTDMRKVKALAGPNVEVLGYQRTEVLRNLMQRAKAFVFAAEEDFGIAPVEAQACGTPVIAYARGGALETVHGAQASRPTGVFFHAQTPAAIAAAVREFEDRQERLTPAACRDNAQRFSVDVFRERYAHFVQSCWERFRQPGSDRIDPSQRVRAYG
jgi:glycosyltransferase involved in cell wall biosynthesis